MALPLLAFVGLGLGAQFGKDKLRQRKEAQIHEQARGLLGAPEQVGPLNGTGPLMSRGTGLMGGELSPLQYSQEMMALGGPYAETGQALQKSLLGYRAPQNAQIIQSGAPGGMVVPKMLQDGQAIDIPGVQPRKVGAAVNINPAVANFGINDAKAFTNEQGQNPAHLIGLPMAEAAAKAKEEGYSMQSTAGEKQTASRTFANSVITNLEKQLWNEEKTGIYDDYGLDTIDTENWPEWAKGPVGDKFAESVTSAWNQFTDQDPRYKTYLGALEGSVAPIVRTFGDSGALNSEDMERALALFPDLSLGLVDSKKVAKAKIAYLKRIVNRGQANFDTGTVPSAAEFNGFWKADGEEYWMDVETKTIWIRTGPGERDWEEIK